MLTGRNLLFGKRKYLYGFILLAFISVICVAFSMVDDNDFDISRREVLLRRIGHELLLQSGDSTSRVLPVKKIAKNEYQVSFENAFSFRPDSLVNTTRRLLAKDPLAGDYVVNVLNCSNSSVAYRYAISKNKKDDIVTCIGRKQPTACYMINIRFKPTGIITATNEYLWGGLLLLAFAGFIFLRAVKPRGALPESAILGSALPESALRESVLPESALRESALPESALLESVLPESVLPERTLPESALPDSRATGRCTLGSMAFDAETRKLMINGKTIDLTRTEARLLGIFAFSPNEAIERSRLQKEIWEDEGVIVGRSLDMFISKLRKKLAFDSTIKIVVLRGKGYKLEISA